MKKLKVEVMQRIGARLGLDLFAFDTEKLENYLVLKHQHACLQSDRDLILGTDYLRKFNVSRHRFVGLASSQSLLFLAISLAIQRFTVETMSEQVGRSLPGNDYGCETDRIRTILS